VGFALSVVNDRLVDDYLDFYFDSFTSLSFAVFACVWTILVGIYISLSFSVWRGSHYRWIIFILLILSTIWWLVAFAYLASDAKDALDAVKEFDASLALGSLIQKRKSYAGSSSSYNKKLADWYDNFRTASKGMAGASGIGALIWILFIVFTIFYSLGLFRKQNNGTVPMGTMEEKQEVQQPYPVVQSPPPTSQFGAYYPPNPTAPGGAPPYNQQPVGEYKVASPGSTVGYTSTVH